MNTGNKIKSLRIEYKMTQEELGTRLGVNRAAINKYEKGTVTNIPIDTLLHMCRIFDVTPNFLLLEEDSSTNLDFIKTLQLRLGDEGLKCFYLINSLSEEGKKRAIQYLEDMQKIYFQK